MATVDMETAESCMYRRPVGFENGTQKFAEGESIRLAEIVGANYGNLYVAGLIVDVSLRSVKARAVAHDLENNFRVAVEVVEATVNKSGQPFSERMRIVAAKAALSKAIRDATFRVVPKSLCKPIINAAKQVIAGSQKPLVERRKAVADWLKKLSISSDRVFNTLGVKNIDEIGDEQLLELTGIRTALKDGETTLDEAFPQIVVENTTEKQGVEGVKERIKKTNIKEQIDTLKKEKDVTKQDDLPWDGMTENKVQ
jgi:hypothetical protein